MKNKLDNNFLSTVFMYLVISVFSLITLIFLIKNNILMSIIAFIVVCYISLKKNIKHFPILLFITSLLIRILAITLFKFPPVSDFKTLLEAASLFKNNNFSFQNSSYFTLWGYQTGFVIYEGLVLKILNSVFILKLLNAIYSAGLCVLVYVFGKKICSEKSAKMAALLYMIFPFSLYLSTILANHHLSTFLMYIGIFFLLKKEKKLKDYIIASVLISIGNIIRPEGIIVVFTLILFEIFRLNKERILETVKNVGIFLIIYIIVGGISSFTIKKLGINDEGLKNNNPKWKFVLGFNEKSCGYYIEEDEKYLKEENEESKIIKERLSVGPVRLGKLMACKINKFWLQTEISSKNEMYDKTYHVLGFDVKFKDLENIVVKFNSIIYIITLLMCIVGVIFNRKKVVKGDAFFFTILIAVTFFVYLLIEIQPRYAYFIHVSIFILSTYGYDYVLNKISQKSKNRKKLK